MAVLRANYMCDCGMHLNQDPSPWLLFIIYQEFNVLLYSVPLFICGVFFVVAFHLMQILYPFYTNTGISSAIYLNQTSVKWIRCKRYFSYIS